MPSHEFIADSGHNIPGYKIKDTCNNCTEAEGCSDLYGDVYHNCKTFNQASVHSTGWCPKHNSAIKHKKERYIAERLIYNLHVESTDKLARYHRTPEQFQHDATEIHDKWKNLEKRFIKNYGETPDEKDLITLLSDIRKCLKMFDDTEIKVKKHG